MSLKFDGFDELEKELKTLQKKASELEGTHDVPLDELFTSDFLKKHSSFSSFDELLSAGNFEVNSQEDFDAIPDDVFDRHIASVTDFDSWESMLGEAASEYTYKQLGF